MSTAQDPYPTIPQRLVRGFLGLMGACVLYAASCGPMVVLACCTGFPSAGTGEKIYTPLIFIAEKTSTDGALLAYVGWWYGAFRPKEGYRFYDEGPAIR